jgi:hypothetical protein
MGTTSGCDGDELFDGTEGGYIAAIHGVRVKEVVVDGENSVGIAFGAMGIQGAMGMRGYRMSRAARGNLRGRGRLRDAVSAARCAGAGQLRGRLRGVGCALREGGGGCAMRCRLRAARGRVGCGGGCAGSAARCAWGGVRLRAARGWGRLRAARGRMRAAGSAARGRGRLRGRLRGDGIGRW